MHSKKAFELAISTLILLVLGILVLIAIIVALTGGFDRFKTTTDPYLDTTEAIALKQACELACENKIPSTFCCDKHDLNNEKVTCSDSKLKIACPEIECTNVCPPPTTT
ncbi:MAG: hypothetical protein ABIG28_00265 [archaeon]